jgi:hypothetical protein
MNNTTKPKRKAKQKNFLQHFVDEYILFRRDFYFESDIEPESLIERIRYHRPKANRWWGTESIHTNLEVINEDWKLLIQAKKHRKSDYIETARAVINFRPQNNLIQIDGVVTINATMLWIGLIVTIFLGLIHWCLSKTASYNNSLLYLILLQYIFLIFEWTKLYIDRNYLYKLVKNAVESAHEYSDKTQAS